MALDEEDDITLEGGEGVTSPLAPSGMEQRLSGTGANSDAIIQALLSQALRTGSQGDARPSYAADAANAQTRVAKILSKSLGELEGSGGLERLGSAAMQTLAGQGRVSLPQVMAAQEQQDVSRAYNIANALSGMAKAARGGAADINPVQLMGLIARNQENARRELEGFQGNVEAQIRTLSSQYDDPAAASQVLRQYLVENGKKVKDYASANKVMAGAAQALSASGLPRKRGAGSERMTPAQTANLAARTEENERRGQAGLQGGIEAQIRTLSSQYDDPAAASQVLRDYFAENGKDVEDYASANRVMAGAAQALSESGLPRKRGATAGRAAAPEQQPAAAPEPGGMYTDDDGTVKWRNFTRDGKTPLSEWEKQANYIASVSGPEAANAFVLERSGRTSGAQAREMQARKFEFQAGQAASAATQRFNTEESRMISTLAKQYGTNATVVEQTMRDFIQRGITEQGVDPNNLDARRALLNGAVTNLNQLNIKMEPRPQVQKLIGDSNIPMLPDGRPNYVASIPNPKDAFGRLWNAAPPERRAEMLARKIDETIAGKEGMQISVATSPDGSSSVVVGGKAGAAANMQAVREYEAAMTGYDSARPVLDRMSQLVAEGGQTIIGPLGTVTNFLGFVKGAANEIFGGALPEDLRGTDAEVAERFDSVMAKAGLRDSGLAKFVSTVNDERAQALKTNIVFATYYIAKTLDGTGNLSNKDTQSVLSAFGMGWNSANSAKAAIKETEKALQARVEARWRAVERTAPQGATMPRSPSFGQQPAAAGPGQKAYPAPSRAAIDALRAGRKNDGTPVTREEFEKYFGPGSAERVLRGGG
jgi:hypothetical protein